MHVADHPIVLDWLITHGASSFESSGTHSKERSSRAVARVTSANLPEIFLQIIRWPGGSILKPTYFVVKSAPMRCKNVRNGTPVHLPIMLQPSTQTCRVTCDSCGRPRKVRTDRMRPLSRFRAACSKADWRRQFI